jgi:hypothetical protein
MPAIPVSRLTPRSISWLWLRRLARGSVAILDGDPGLGKSLVTLDFVFPGIGRETSEKVGFNQWAQRTCP